MFGVKCGTTKMSGKMISHVLDLQGNDSKLYEDILNHLKELPKEEVDSLKERYKPYEEEGITGDLDNTKHLALALYANTFSPNFTRSGIVKNEKGEVNFVEAKKKLFSPTEKKEVMQQKNTSTTSSKASPETVAKYTEWAQRAGFDIKPFEQLTDEKGNKIGHNGSIDLLGKIIEIAKGKEDVATGEEVGHGIVRMIRETNPSLFKEMMNSAAKYSLYSDVMNDYRSDKDYQNEDGKPNIPKIKEETLGKIFNELVIKRSEGETEKPELLAKANSWFDKIKEFIKNLLTKVGFDPTFDPIDKAAKDFVEGKINYKGTHNLFNNKLGKLNFYDKGTTSEDHLIDIHSDKGLISLSEQSDGTFGVYGINIFKDSDENKGLGKQLYLEAAKYIKDKYNKDIISTGTVTKNNHIWESFIKSGQAHEQNDRLILDKPDFSLLDKPKDIFKQKGDEGQEKRDELFDKISKPPVVERKDDGDGQSHYETLAGEKVARVTDWVKNFLTSLFKNKEFKADLNTVLQDFKKQYGSARHKDMEHIHERHIDPQTGLLREHSIPLNFHDAHFAEHTDEDKAYYQILENYLYGYVDDGGIRHEGMVTNKVDFPEGTKFMWEKTIFDPTTKVYDADGKNASKGLAGTLDFMAISPEGKVSLFDWKFIGSLAKNEGIRDYMKKAYDRQMSGYLKILTSPTYGVDISDIEKVRMIPVAVKYNEEKGHEGEVSALNIGTTDYKNEKTPYLLPYVTSSERSKEKPIQGLIDSLTQILNKATIQGLGEKDILVRKNKIANLERAILHLQLSQDFTPFLEQVKSFNKDSIDNLSKIRKDIKDFNPKEIKSLSDLDSKLEPLIDIIKNLELYRSLRDFIGYVDGNTESGKKQIDDFRSVSDNAAYLLKDNDKRLGANGLLNSYVKSWADSRSIWDILKPQTALNYLSKEFRTPSKSPSTAIRATYDINNIRLDRVEKETNEMIEKIKPLWETITKGDWGGVKKLSEIIEAKDKNGKGTNKLIDEFSKETTSKLEKAISDKKPKEVRELLDDVKFNAWATPYREEQLKQINASTWLPAYGKSAEERKQDAIDRVMSETTWSSDYSIGNFGRLKGFLKDSLRSEEYKNMLRAENKPALDFYNFVMDVNKQAVAAGMFHQSHMKTFLPWIEKSLADKVEYGGRWNLWDKIREGFTSHKDGEVDEQIDPFTNKVISKIPKYFTKETYKIDKDGEKDYSTVADDLIKNVGIFAEAMIDYRSKIATQNTFEALKVVEEAKGMLLTDSQGNIKGHADENKNLQHLVDYLEVHINDKSLLSKLDFKGGSVNIDGEERAYDVRKSLETLKAWFSYNVLGFNSVTSVFRTITTGVTGIYNSGKYYEYNEFLKNYSKFANFTTFRNDASLTTKLMKAFLPVEENLQLELDHLAGSKVADADFQAFSMKMVKSAHNIVQYVNYLSHMDNAIIINGKLMNAREYANRNSNKYGMSEADRKDFEKNLNTTVKDLVEKHGLVNHSKVDENGKLVIDGLDMDDFSVADFKSMIRTQGRMLSGNISENDQSHIRSNAIARQMFLFTNWLPQSIDQRFGSLAYNQGTQSYEYGRMKMLANIWFNSEGHSLNIIKKISYLSDLYKANEKGVSELHKMYEDHKAEYLRKTGLELHMTPDEFYDMVRNNIKIQGRETLALLTFIGLSVGLSAALPKKDDSDWENAQGYFAYTRRVINRAKDELEMFFNPLKFAEFGSGSKLPVLGIFGELTAVLSHLAKFGYGIATDEDTEKTHVIPQIIHTLPNGKAIYDIGSVIFPSWYKENTGSVLNPDPQGSPAR